MVNVLYDIQGCRFTVGNMQVVGHPSYQMIFEDSFDELVQKVRCKEFMDIHSWKPMCVRNDIMLDSKLIP
ncbi:hypothetical protein L208DRAFT_1412282, partial [Tricholoma matsutake]